MKLDPGKCIINTFGLGGYGSNWCSVCPTGLALESLHGGRVLKRVSALVLCFCLSSTALGDVWAAAYLADGETPLELADPNVPFVYRDIMVGTKLTIIINSDTADGWDGTLELYWAHADCGAISARDCNDVTRYCQGSHLEAAGAQADVSSGADFLATYVSFRSYGDGSPGQWFIIDYYAIDVGDCSVALIGADPESWSGGFDPDNPPPGAGFLIHELVFSHVPTRDFNEDTKVDFADFAILTSFLGVTNCADSNWCEGTDLDTDGDVDRDDLMMFADYWLESTQ